MADQPEALRLADALDARVVPRWVHGTGQTPKQSGYKKDAKCEQAAACLRRQHAEIERLKAQRDALRAALELYRGQVDQTGRHSAAEAIDRAVAGPVEPTVRHHCNRSEET